VATIARSYSMAAILDGKPGPKGSVQYQSQLSFDR
jgi:hypothetical protein